MVLPRNYSIMSNYHSITSACQLRSNREHSKHATGRANTRGPGPPGLAAGGPRKSCKNRPRHHCADRAKGGARAGPRLHHHPHPRGTRARRDSVYRGRWDLWRAATAKAALVEFDETKPIRLHRKCPDTLFHNGRYAYPRPGLQPLCDASKALTLPLAESNQLMTPSGPIVP